VSGVQYLIFTGSTNHAVITFQSFSRSAVRVSPSLRACVKASGGHILSYVTNCRLVAATCCTSC